MIHIKQNYKSSVRLDESFSEEQFINGLVLHGTALNALDVLSKDLINTKQRCFTLTGPYGSGKSTLALYLSLLLSKNKKAKDLAGKKLLNEAPYSLFLDAFKVKLGWKVIKHVCGLEEPAYSIANAICDEVSGEQVASDLTNAEYLALIKKALSKKGRFDGVVILLDEMGKALDYQARENQDLYFFQQLADVVQQSNNNVTLVGFLHQSFSEYSRSMTAQVQREWAKVQGRYRDISYSPSIDESLILVGDTIGKEDALQKKLERQFSKLTELVGEKFAGRKNVTSPLKKALPIDPVISLLLGPISKRSFSQNERSLFGFLASNEKLSFNQFILGAYSNSSNQEDLPLYNADLFWDYLTLNLDHIISSSRDSQVWLEAKDAVYRSTLKGNELHESMTKLIALVTLFGYQHQLFASKAFIKNYYQYLGYSACKIEKVIDELEQWMVIIYRPNHDALTIFQGSDVDVNELVTETIDLVKEGIDWTQELDFSQHVLASSHYHKTGTMRWVEAKIVSEKLAKELTKISTSPKENEPFLFFVIPENHAAENVVKQVAAENDRIVLGHSRSIEAIKSYSLELVALTNIIKENKKIAHDRIAKKELNNRVLLTERLIEREFDKALQKATWQYLGDEYSNFTISALASQFANSIYSASPIVANELVNRTKPSGSANAAIKKLILAMAENYAAQDLEFPKDTFPAEKGLYYSCIKHFGLHKEVDGEFQFSEPSNPELKALFDKTHEELILNSHSVVWLADIDRFWASRPYGLTKGIRTIWLMAFVLVHLRDYAFYDKNEATGEVIFITEPDDEFVLKLFQKPQNVAVQAVQIDQEKTAYLTYVAEALDAVNNTPSHYSNDVTPLKVAEGLVTFYSQLSNWTANTSVLLSKARKFIEVTKKASDPHEYLFKSLPKLIGEDLETISSEQVRDLLSHIKNAHVEMLNNFEASVHIQLGGAFSVANCEAVIRFTADFRLKSFAQRLSEAESNNSRWVANVISLLSGKSEKNWDDSAIKKAESELPELVEKFKIATHRANFKNDDLLSGVNKQYPLQVSKIKDALANKTMEEQRTILVAMLDEIEQKEPVNEL